MGFRDATNRNWGAGDQQSFLGILNPTWQVFEKKTFTKIEVHAGMVERLVRYLAIEEALQEKNKRHTRTQQSIIW